ncbi:MAG: ankyrin repeat domain-containing protein [Treponema sp.]|nr:ankyrin repeat domain-containing protein [Treponema sp.]
MKVEGFDSVEIEVNGKTYEYFMFNQLDVVNNKLAELGCRPPVSLDYRYNPSLSNAVKDKMVELGMCYSLTLSHNTEVLNYYTKGGTPFVIFLNELKTPDSKKIKAVYAGLKKLEETISKTNPKVKLKFSPLMTAVGIGAVDVVEKLIASGADVNEKMSNGITALHVASVKGDADMVQLLLKNGANVNMTNDNGFSPLSYSIVMEREDVSDILIKAGANLNIPIATKVNGEKITFNQKLNEYISQFTLQGRGKPSAIYKATEIYNGHFALSKQTFSKIRNERGENYHPEKKNVFLLAIGMHLTLLQTEDLLSSAGYAFDSSSKFDMVVKRFIEERNFNMGKLEETLYNEVGETFCKYN